MINSKKPVSMFNKITQKDFAYSTRNWFYFNDGKCESNLKIGPSKSADHLLTNRSFRCRASKQWNRLPIELRLSKSDKIFKKSLKAWIQTNISLKPYDNK